MEQHPKRFLVWGAGGHGRMVGDLIRVLGHSLMGYIDRQSTKYGQTVEPLGVTVAHMENQLVSYIRSHARYPEGIQACGLGIGNNEVRHRCLALLNELEVPPLVHPSATVSPSAHIGRGTVVFPHAVVNAGARIGEGVIINTGSIVEHDCVLQSAAHISPGAIVCGGTRIGERSWIGAGSTIVHEIVIGRDATVGAGSTVIGNIDDNAVVIGSPARAKRLHETAQHEAYADNRLPRPPVAE